MEAAAVSCLRLREIGRPGASIAEPPPHAAPETSEPGRRRKYALAAGWFSRSLVLLIVWVVYPTIYTIVQSLYGVDRVRQLRRIRQLQDAFTTDIFQTAIKNNAIWVAVVPALRRRSDSCSPSSSSASPVGRLQDGRVHADGDLRVRSGDHVADCGP